MVFVGLGGAERRILSIIRPGVPVTVADAREAWPDTDRKTHRQAMKSLARKGFVQVMRGPVFAIGTHPVNMQAPAPLPATVQAPPPRPATVQAPPPRPATVQAPVPRPATMQAPAPRPATVQVPAPRSAKMQPSPASPVAHVIKPVVLPGAGIEIMPASASGGFDRPKFE
jgi:hypothetical protein